jgi:hypothetical protein
MNITSLFNVFSRKVVKKSIVRVPSVKLWHRGYNLRYLQKSWTRGNNLRSLKN